MYFNKYISESERDSLNSLLTDKPIVKNLALIEEKLYKISKNKLDREYILNNNVDEYFKNNDNNIFIINIIGIKLLLLIL